MSFLALNFGMDTSAFEKAISDQLAHLQHAVPAAEQAMAAHIAGSEQDTVPVVSGALRDSIHTDGNQVIADAPHAVIVETTEGHPGFGFAERALEHALPDLAGIAAEHLHHG